MKYVLMGSNDHDPDLRSWRYDSCGNRLDKETGEFVILVPPTKENIENVPVSLVKIKNEWLLRQMELDFG